MAVLKDILYKVSITSTSGNMGQEVSTICMDSRQVQPGSLFVAVRGTTTDGHAYMEQAIRAGAVAVVAEQLPEQLQEGVTYVTSPHTAKALGFIASNFYGNPSSKLSLVGITGTNGKTTTATLLYHLFLDLGYKTGLLSTVENRIDEEVLPATHTTPDAISLNALLAEMVKRGCTHCFMEASSHAIEQERIAGLQFAGAVFSNISHDHLDYHKTFDNYIKAKKKMFDELSPDAFALVNADDKRGTVMLQNTRATKRTFALGHLADYKARILSNTLQGLELEIDGQLVWFRLIGDFNAYNLLSVYGTAVLLGEDSQTVLTALSSLEGAPGRFEQVMPGGKVTAIVDYAHTPDALKNVLETISQLRTGNEQVITVVGCGGNRDKEKRPLMASIACKLSNKVVLTSDNPRDEDPEQIIRDMQAGISPADFKKTLVLVNREEAIKTACLLANDNDIILVAGKGHENYQEIKGVKHPFDDKEVLGRMLKMMH
jgi:UDP-N-acetylmuramoyl-L-alanyl-D-glutamate--2,6-diaminopimelate ligase